MYCDKCRYGRRLVWHAELNRIICPECGRTPQVLQDKISELENSPPTEPGTSSNAPTIVTADGFGSSGSPVNLGGMKMKAKFGPRAYSTIQQDEFVVDDDTKQMLENNPDYRLVDYRSKDPE